MEKIPLSGTIIDFWKDIAYGEGGEKEAFPMETEF